MRAVIRAQWTISPALLLPERPRCWGEITCASVPNHAVADSGTSIYRPCGQKNNLMANLLERERANKALFFSDVKTNISHCYFLDDNIYKHTNSNSSCHLNAVLKCWLACINDLCRLKLKTRISKSHLRSTLQCFSSILRLKISTKSIHVHWMQL